MTPPPPQTPVTAVRNIWPAMAETLARVGVTTAEDLRRNRESRPVPEDVGFATIERKCPNPDPGRFEPGAAVLFDGGIGIRIRSHERRHVGAFELPCHRWHEHARVSPDAGSLVDRRTGVDDQAHGCLTALRI